MAGQSARDVKLWSPVVKWEERPGGEFLVWRDDPLGAYPDKLNERLVHWAKTAPDRAWMADRDATGGWRTVTYGEALDRVRRIGQFLLDLKLSAESPLVILSENSIEHALMALGAQHVGIPSAAIAPAYATLSADFGKLAEIAAQITPGLVFADDAAVFRKAVDTAFGDDVPFVAISNLPGDRSNSYQFEDVIGTEPTAAVDEAFDAVGPDTMAKFLFTSGTTGSPKGVIQTQRMLCSNQEMVADCYAYFRDEPPVLVDWSPWNHTASGNKCFNIVIYHGGTYYIDRGKPTPKLIGQTIANLREISPTWYFNVPAGYEMLVQEMREDDTLRQNFFKNLKMMMYAGAGMAQHTWDALIELAEMTVGGSIPLGTGLGSTETAPFSLFCTDPQDKPGNIGIPAQGVTLKLVPFEDKFELRLKGPNITPGYWRNEKLTAAAFDEEGFYRIGDAVKFAVPGDPSKGFYFDGRTAENFKLQTGTWVAVGMLRAQFVNQFGGLIRDAVITGENRAELGALAVPFMPALREIIAGETGLSDEAVIAHPKVRTAIASRLAGHQRQASGSATRIMRVMLMTEPLRFEKGEVTDKGSINQRAVLAQRKDLVEALYADGVDVIRVGKELAA
ncbi:trans-feruloyl-CoA synthase [Neorhizobium sp. R1-B]|jgi:feruloyl-CoA synthase|uniref:feruloyl-CoA synthase n=1 Tax=unclassified Neorhizobium TaxID=2629175 RepID=UPI0010474BAD|nr:MULTISPECIES: feruloyl-CoA synthase [unclassified Neorhizobium]TCV59685.1 trans-feruloyl-CoA synthase [Neorhizobium sp. S3-V5DH]TDX70166.1 trans-feruloyl-CoA synthase [Neorhizobium sp. R1-B]